MVTEPLTKAEAAWIKKVERLLMNPPSNRIGMFTMGDAELRLYDRSRDSEIDIYHQENHGEFANAVENLWADLGSINSACQIHSTAG